MHRFYIAPENWNPDALVLSGSEAHHARDVLRMKRGDKLVVFNGRGREITAEIVDGTGDNIRLRKLHEAETPPLRCRITLGQAIPKGKEHGFDRAESGRDRRGRDRADHFRAHDCRSRSGKRAQKQAKWQQIAIEAAKQCGQNWLPQVHTPRKNSFSVEFRVCRRREVSICS